MAVTRQTFAQINSAAAGDVTVQAGVTGWCIRVLGYVFQCNGSDTLTLRSDDSTTLAGPFCNAANTGVAAPVTTEGWFDIPRGQNLILTKAAAVQVGGHVKLSWRQEVPG